MSLHEVASAAVDVIEVSGIGVLVGGVVLTAVLAVRLLRRGGVAVYEPVKVFLGRSILLGLELLVAADIIHTVAIELTLQSVGVLAAIVAVRTFLSWSLELEISGHWPWQQPAATTAPEHG